MKRLATNTERRIWRVHPRPHHILRLDEFLERNVIAVGWGKLPNLADQSRHKIYELHQKFYPELRVKIGKDVGQLDYLVNQIDIDDAVVMSGTLGREVYFGIVASPYKYNPKFADDDDQTGERGYPHHRRIRWLFDRRPISVLDIPKEIRDALKARQPIVRINGDHKRIFEMAKLFDEEVDADKPSEGVHSARPQSASQDEFDAYDGVVEGEPRLVIRLARMREAKFRAAKVEQARRIGDGRLRCEVPGCRFDFEERYGALGAGFIHIHHIRPLNEYVGPRNLDGLMLICPNCHAMVHRGGECRDPTTLIQS